MIKIKSNSYNKVFWLTQNWYFNKIYGLLNLNIILFTSSTENLFHNDNKLNKLQGETFKFVGIQNVYTYIYRELNTPKSLADYTYTHLYTDSYK